MAKHAGEFVRGEISEQEFIEYEDCAMPTCGSCAGMYTANSMSCMTEVLGMSLPDNGTVPAVFSARERLAKHTGMKVMDLWAQNLRARDILTKCTFQNAITMDMLIGCSTNTLLHLPAIVRECGITVSLEDFDRKSRETPVICSLSPGGPDHLVDFYYTGGIQALLKVALDGGLINGGIMIVTGRTVAENDKEARVWDEKVIRPLDSPRLKSGGLCVLYGNLAPEGCVVKAAALSAEQRRFTGPARVFDSESAAKEAVLAGAIRKGDALVVRYEGPKGAPGMPEMAWLITLIQSTELGESTFIITDGRFSGITRGACVGHVCPEAAEGGPIALVRDGDRIEIDIEDLKLTLLVDDAELEKRRAAWEHPPTEGEERVPGAVRETGVVCFRRSGPEKLKRCWTDNFRSCPWERQGKMGKKTTDHIDDRDDCVTLTESAKAGGTVVYRDSAAGVAA